MHVSENACFTFTGKAFQQTAAVSVSEEGCRLELVIEVRHL